MRKISLLFLGMGHLNQLSNCLNTNELIKVELPLVKPFIRVNAQG